MKFRFRFLFFLLISISLSCEKKNIDLDDLMQDSPWGPLQQKSPEQCPNDFDSNEITFKPAPPEISKTEFLNKPYAKNYFEKMLISSPKSLIEFLHRQKLMVFKAEDSKNTCSIFKNLNTMPSFLKSNWDNQNSNAKNDQHKVMGLFFAEYIKYSNRVELSRKAIILRDSSSKWHLVHESMHYFFAVQRLGEDLAFPDDMNQKWQSANESLKKSTALIQNQQDTQNLKNWTKAADNFFELSKLKDSRTTLEEFMIENMLIKAYVQNQFISTDRDSAIQAFYYLESQYLLVRPAYAKLLEQALSIKTKSNSTDADTLIKKIEDFLSHLDNEYYFVKQSLN